METSDRAPGDEAGPLDSFLALMDAAWAVAASLVRDRAFGHLTPSQFAVLAALRHDGSLSQTGLAGRIGKSTGNLVTIINNLQKQGLVIRARLKTDRRVVNVILTEKGRQVVEELIPRHAMAIARAMSVLPESEQGELRRLCRSLSLHSSR